MNDNEQNIACEMFKHEHIRWNQHSLFFLGIIGAILLSLGQLEKVIPLQWIFLILTIISFFWLCAILANRGSSFAWLQTIKKIESSNPIKPQIFTEYDDQLKNFSQIKDLLSNFAITEQNGLDKKRRFLLFKTVTRAYVGLSLVFVITFGIITYIQFSKKVSFIDSSNILGRKLINTQIYKIYPDAKIVETIGPIKTEKDSIIQVRIERKNRLQKFLYWNLDSNGHAFMLPDTISNATNF